ncbi:clusterin-like protein 1 isoform X2 [Xenopus laevis]|uniref:Clusterin n=1 Tax=Xenopus laevis TaxID=8355 RepID=A0A8J1L008_XENLA|nr:clusterin-like protein 1 isoform X2 [Xenopus laevis]
MNLFLLLAPYLLWLKTMQTAPTPELEEMDLRIKMKALSKIGEEYVAEEIKKALTGIKKMKNIMEENEEKHENILKSLRKTTEEKTEAIRLFMEINEKINEVEIQCREQLTDNMEGCKTCLQRSCITFYISNCSQGITLLPIKIFQDRNEEEAIILGSYKLEEEHFPQAENSFHQLLSDIKTLFNRGLVFFRNIQQELDQSFQSTFMSGVNLADPDTQTDVPNKNSVIIIDSLKHWDLSSWIQYLYDCSKAIFQGITDALYSVFKHLHQDNKPLALPMEDCPDVLQLHVKSEEVFKLVGIAEQQYQDLTHIIQQHAEDTATLMSLMKDRFGWVVEHNNMPIGTDTIFSIEKVTLGPSNNDGTANETVVEVSILKSPALTVRVPASIDLENPKSVQYIAEIALRQYINNV